MFKEFQYVSAVGAGGFSTTVNFIRVQFVKKNYTQAGMLLKKL